jgi:hypothetical protein
LDLAFDVFHSLPFNGCGRILTRPKHATNKPRT